MQITLKTLDIPSSEVNDVIIVHGAHLEKLVNVIRSEPYKITAPITPIAIPPSLPCDKYTVKIYVCGVDVTGVRRDISDRITKALEKTVPGSWYELWQCQTDIGSFPHLTETSFDARNNPERTKRLVPGDVHDVPGSGVPQKIGPEIGHTINVADTSSAVNHPAHYGGEDDPYEAIKVIDAWGVTFAVGNSLKYIRRNGRKAGTTTRQDLEKARWYLDHEIARLTADGR